MNDNKELEEAKKSLKHYQNLLKEHGVPIDAQVWISEQIKCLKAEIKSLKK